MWLELLELAGINEKEGNVLLVLSTRDRMKASDIAKELKTTRLDAYNTLSKLQQRGLVKATADRPMMFSCPRIQDCVRYLIDIKQSKLNRLNSGLEDLLSGIPEDKREKAQPSFTEEPEFSVIKERENIYSKLKGMADDTEEKLVLILGKYGILHLCRTGAIEAVNQTAVRGCVVEVIAHVENRTVKFFDKLHESIEVRHSEELDSTGFLQDEEVTVQLLHVEENPVGKGKDDAALIIESQSFSQAQSKLVQTIWEESINFDIAVERFVNNRIVDPLKMTIGEGSFLTIFSEALGFDGELPQEDTPFDPELFYSAGMEVNKARTQLSEGKLSNLQALGIDMNVLLRQIGNRVGLELAFSLRSLSNDIDFLNEMIDWWEFAGLGKMSYDIDSAFSIQIELAHEIPEDPEALPVWELDDGIIEGALSARFSTSDSLSVRKAGQDLSAQSFMYELIETAQI